MAKASCARRGPSSSRAGGCAGPAPARPGTKRRTCSRFSIRPASPWRPTTKAAARARSRPAAPLGREAVLLTFPPEAGQGGRTIRATSLDAKGEPKKGLTRAQFSGNVQFREKVGDTGRAANSATLDIGLKPAFSTIEDAKFM